LTYDLHGTKHSKSNQRGIPVSFLKSKHTIVAVLIAPLLTVMAWYGVDLLVGEKPKPAEGGQSYALAEKPGCRWASGSCEMKNGDFELALAPDWKASGRLGLTLESVFPLEGVRLALVTDETEEAPPQDMQAIGTGGTTWYVELPGPDAQYDRLRLVASAKGALYFGDVALKFALREEVAD
jgi:hypothetical protein